MLDAYADAGVDVLEVGIPSHASRGWMAPRSPTSMARALEAGADAAPIAVTLGAWRQRRVAAGGADPRDPLVRLPGAAHRGDPGRRDRRRHRCAPHDRAVPPRPGRDARRWAGRLGSRAAPSCPGRRRRTTTPRHRRATGYLMVPARPGLTGAGGPVADPAPLVRRARVLAPGRPVVSGFGIEGPMTSRACSARAWMAWSSAAPASGRSGMAGWRR